MTTDPIRHSGVARMRRHTSSPSIPGSITSSSTTSKRPRRSAARPRSPSPTTVTSISWRPRYSATIEPNRASSSTRSADILDGGPDILDGGPEMAPKPPTLGAPRLSRGTPRYCSSASRCSPAVSSAVVADPVGHGLALDGRQHVVHLRERLRDRVGHLRVLGLALRAKGGDASGIDRVGFEERERLGHVRLARLVLRLHCREG